MGILAEAADERVADVRFDENSIIVDLLDGRTIMAPLAFYPRLMAQRPRSVTTGRRLVEAMEYTGRTSTKTCRPRAFFGESRLPAAGPDKSGT